MWDRDIMSLRRCGRRFSCTFSVLNMLCFFLFWNWDAVVLDVYV